MAPAIRHPSKAQSTHRMPSFRRGREPFVTGHASLVTGREPLMRGHESLGRGHERLVTGHASLGRGHEPFVRGHESLGRGHERLLTGHESLATSFLSRKRRLTKKSVICGIAVQPSGRCPDSGLIAGRTKGHALPRCPPVPVGDGGGGICSLSKTTTLPVIMIPERVDSWQSHIQFRVTPSRSGVRRRSVWQRRTS